MKRGLTLIGEIIPEMILSESAEEIYKNILSFMKKMLNFGKCAIYVRYKDGISEDDIFSLDSSSPAVVRAAEAGTAIHNKNEMAVPVVVEGRTMGILYAGGKEFEEDDRFILDTISRAAAASIKNLEIKREMVQSEKKYRSIIENAVEGIYVSSLDGEIIDVNPSLVKFFGYDSREELRKAGIHGTYKNPEEREEFVRRVIEEKKVRNYEIEYIRKDGEVVIGNEFAAIVENGEKVIHGIIHDVTELKKVQREVEFYNALLRHDMWNKNQIVMGYLELLSGTGLSEEQSRFVETAKLAVKNNIMLIEDVKKLFVRGKHHMGEVEIDEAIEDIINQLLREADRRGISIYYTPSGIKIGGIPLLKEVFYNILLNAILHSQCRNIRICARQEENFCKIRIEDDGIGIPPEIRKDIFRRKVEKGRRNGLGLYLSGKIVEMGGGSIDIRNRVDKGNIKGTIFEISLPMQNDFKR